MEMGVLSIKKDGACEIVRIGYKPSEPAVGGTDFWDYPYADMLVKQHETSSQATWRRKFEEANG